MEIKQNKLVLGGISAEDLAKKYGTPLYVYEKDTIMQRYNSLYFAITLPKKRIYYACKANTNPKIMRMLKELGCGIDAITQGECEIALRCGFRNEDIIFTGVNFTKDEMEFCIKNSILMNIGSLMQLEEYGKRNPGSRVAVRINPDVGAAHHSHNITGGPESKFGIYYDKAVEIKNIVKKHNLKLAGVQQHIGSGILDIDKYIFAMDVLINVAKQFPGLEFVDFGGGIGVNYKPEDAPIDIREFGKKVSEKFMAFCKEYGSDVILCMEPGRFIVCESGVLLAEVVNRQETPNHKFVGINAGFNTLVRPTMYGSYHPIINASNADAKDKARIPESSPDKSGKEKVIIAGNVCESGDVFTRDEDGLVDRELPLCKIGDIIAITHAGAYGFAMASEYNSRPLPSEILVANGKAEVIRERGSFKDLVRNTELAEKKKI